MKEFFVYKDNLQRIVRFQERQLKCRSYVLSKKKNIIKQSAMNTSVNLSASIISDLILDLNKDQKHFYHSIDINSHIESCIDAYILTFAINILIESLRKNKDCMQLNNCDTEECNIVDDD